MRRSARIDEVVKGCAQIAEHVIEACDGTLGARDAAEVEAEEAELRLLGIWCERDANAPISGGAPAMPQRAGCPLGRSCRTHQGR